MKAYLNIANLITDFLFENQVIVPEQQLLFKPFENVFFAEFQSKFIRKDPYEHVIPLYLIPETENFCLTDSYQEEKSRVPLGNIFRVHPKGISRGIAPDVELPPSPIRAFIIKGKENGYRKLITKIYWTIQNNYKKTGYFDFAIRAALRKHLSLTLDTRKRLENAPGVSFIFKSAEIVSQGIRVTLKSYDMGGIFDDNLNSEGKYYPQQVAGNYYADAYAAWWFLHRYRKERDQKFLDAGLLALDFMRRIYPRYQAANIVWHHSDFKNPVIIESICELLPAVAPEKAKRYEELLKKIKEDSYEPTNVYALRLHTYAVSGRHGIKRNPIKRWLALNRLKKDQTQDGLIRDVLPKYHEDARDLTYHQYMMACIARSLAHKSSQHLRKIFIKGVRFSLALLTPDGEVAYLGRCANNVYHSAAAIYAFEFASNLSEVSNTERGQYKRAARLILSYIKPWQRSSGDFPTALNHHFEKRLGWSHCRTPYNALSGYFLYQAALVHQKELAEYPVPMEVEDAEYFKYFEDSGFVAFSNRDYYSVLFSGGDPSYWWSEGTHRSGWSGIAILGKPGCGSITGILEESREIQGDITYGNFGRKRIKVHSKKVFFYKNGKIYQKYQFTNKGIAFYGDKIASNLFILNPSSISKFKKSFFYQLISFIEDDRKAHNVKKLCVVSNPNGLVEVWQYN